MSKFFVQHNSYETFIDKLINQGADGQTLRDWLVEGAGRVFGSQLKYAINRGLGELVDTVRDQIVTFGGRAAGENTALAAAIDGADGIMTSITVAQLLPTFRVDLSGPNASGNPAEVIQAALQETYAEETVVRGGEYAAAVGAGVAGAALGAGGDSEMNAAVYSLAKSVTALANSL